jgi:uncharacterized BrkB/YihY/UPF0761 family membrane protein
VNLAERVVRAVDRAQQRNRPVGFVFSIVKKYGDDRGPSLSALIAYYGFLSLFPALLVLTTVVGFIGNARIADGVIGSALGELPVFGEQIGRDANHPLHGSVVGLVVGLLGTSYGSLGVAQAAQHAMAQIWNVPGVVRPGFGPRMARSGAFFVLLATSIGVIGWVSSIGVLDGDGFPIKIAAFVVQAGLTVGLYLLAFRVLTPKSIPFRDLVVGAVAGGLAYSVLLLVGAALVQHQLRHAEVLYGQFALVLGLLTWLYLVAQVTLYAAELNVVVHRHLWPRSIVQPPLTEADERVLADIARQEERRPEQRVAVGFDARDEPG